MGVALPTKLILAQARPSDVPQQAKQRHTRTSHCTKEKFFYNKGVEITVTSTRTSPQNQPTRINAPKHPDQERGLSFERLRTPRNHFPHKL